MFLWAHCAYLWATSYCFCKIEPTEDLWKNNWWVRYDNIAESELSSREDEVLKSIVRDVFLEQIVAGEIGRRFIRRDDDSWARCFRLFYLGRCRTFAGVVIRELRHWLCKS